MGLMWLGIVLGGLVCFLMGFAYQWWIVPAIRRRGRG